MIDWQAAAVHAMVAAATRTPLPPMLPTGRLQDLAGSERQDKTGAVGQTAVEGSQINKSLR